MSQKSDKLTEHYCVIAMEWLRNELAEHVSRDRILIQTFGAGFLCHWESSTSSFAVKYIFDEHGALALYGMGSAESSLAYGRQTAALSKAIDLLYERDEIRRIDAPREYDSGVCLYGLPQ